MDIQKEDFGGRFTAAGQHLPDEAGALAVRALAAAVTQELKTMLVDFTGVSMSRSLSIAECYRLGEQLATAGAGLLRVAFLTPGHCITAHRFVFEVATNRGLTTDAFTSEEKALQWLQGVPRRA